MTNGSSCSLVILRPMQTHMTVEVLIVPVCEEVDV